MKTISIKFLSFLIFIFISLFISCSELNEDAIFLDDSARHPAGWLQGGHQAAASRNFLECARCHGSDFRGGVSGVSCFLCHNGPSGHPFDWVTEHSLVARQGTSSCATQNCHGTDFMGGNSGVSCWSCHLGGPTGRNHPVDWTDPFDDHRPFLIANGKDATSCSYIYCHGPDLTGGIDPPNGSWSGAPTCFLCHGKEWNIP